MPQTNKVVTQVNQLLEEASKATRGNPEKCIELSEKALEIAKLNDDDLGIGNAYANIGSGYYHQSDYKKAIDYYLLAELIIRKEQFYRGLRGIYNNLGIIYCRRNELAKALEYYYKNLELEDDYQDPRSNCLILNNIGRVYSLLDDYKKALQYYKEVLDICEEHNFLHERLITLNNIGYSYFKLKDPEMAEDYLLIAVDAGRDNNNKSGLMTVYSSLAELKTETGEYEQALDLLSQAFRYAEELGDQYKTAKFCLYMANTYEKIDHLVKQKYYLEKCVAIAEPNKYRSIALSAYEALAQLHEKQSVFQQSIECYKKVQQIKDFLNDEKRTRTVHEIITKMEVERTERENERLRLKTLELEKQNQLIMVSKTFDKLLDNENYDNKYQIINDSEKMNNVLLLMDQVAKVDNTDVLITGESGTGKELVARGIHLLSSRKQNMFFDINCTAIPDTLFESEFFGHTKNAFTGADSLKKG